MTDAAQKAVVMIRGAVRRYFAESAMLSQWADSAERDAEQLMEIASQLESPGADVAGLMRSASELMAASNERLAHLIPK